MIYLSENQFAAITTDLLQLELIEIDPFRVGSRYLVGVLNIANGL